MMHNQSNNNPHTTTTTTTTTTTIVKHPKLTTNHHSLLPGLPDHISQLCLSLIPPTTLHSVCRSWRRLIYSGDYPPFRSLYILSLPTKSQLPTLLSFDPISSKWTTVDSPPLPPLTHPSFISRNLPIQSLSVSGNLIIIAGTTVHRSLPVPALFNPLMFDPLTNVWSYCPPLDTPRRWCAAGALHDTVVVASGIGSCYTESVARSVEKWVVKKHECYDEKIQALKHLKVALRQDDKQTDNKLHHNRLSNGKRYPTENRTLVSKDQEIAESLDEKPDGYFPNVQSFHNMNLKKETLDENPYGYYSKMQPLNHRNQKTKSSNEKWEKMQSLKHSKLCREPIEAIGYKGKLCMVNVKGDYAKEGFIYNLDSDEWEEMPEGMLSGWRGPTAAIDEETMYVVDESRGVLRRYNEDSDMWLDVMVDERLKGAECMAASGGRVCVVGEKGVGIVVVDVEAVPPRLWVVETPVGYDVLAVHILPRMCLPEV